MPRISKNFRFPPATIERLAWLKSRYSSETATLILAIDKLYEDERSTMNVRKLTPAEIEAFPGQSSIDVAMQSTNGVWYYADSNPTEDDPSGFADAQFVQDEGGYYIEIPASGDTERSTMTTDQAPQYQYWDHLASGETYAIRIEGGTVTSCVGPVAYDEIDPDNIELHEYDDQDWLEDAENLNPEDYRLYVPNGIVYP